MFSVREAKTLEAIAEALIPAGKFFPAGGKNNVKKLETYFQEDPSAEKFYRIVVKFFDTTVKLTKLSPFAELPLDERRRILEEWLNSPNLIKRGAAEIVTITLKVSHFSDDEIYSKIGCVWNKSPKSYQLPPYMTNVKNEIEDEEIECDVVVVGSGAGGAVVAKELSEKGLGVIIVEEGKYYTRKDFSGKAAESFRKFYRDKGLTFAIGNTIIPIPMGRLVGGSTTINTGTSWRTPPRILERWVKSGLSELSPKNMERYFEKVEATIQVEEAGLDVIGGIAKVIARGCQSLGLKHHPLRRNAPDCDGQGVCTFGCPTDAKKSMNVSYIPLALKSGALLLEETKFEKIIIKDGKAEGIITKSKSGKKITIRAKATVLSCGAIITPFYLLENGFKNKNIGRNLTIHPCTSVLAYLPNDDIRQFNHTPQGYCIDSFMNIGILLLHGGLPLDAGAGAIPFVGEKFSFAMSNFDKIASFGAMIEDDPSGRVLSLNHKPFIFYWLKERELKLLKFGIEIIIKVFLEAGADEIYPMIRKCNPIRTWGDFSNFQKSNFSPSDYIISAFHPLGTCRMGTSPSNSVVDTNHKLWDAENLFIVDGSTVPTSIGVNPQITIMALATRAAEKIAEAIFPI